MSQPGSNFILLYLIIFSVCLHLFVNLMLLKYILSLKDK